VSIIPAPVSEFNNKDQLNQLYCDCLFWPAVESLTDIYALHAARWKAQYKCINSISWVHTLEKGVQGLQGLIIHPPPPSSYSDTIHRSGFNIFLPSLTSEWFHYPVINARNQIINESVKRPILVPISSWLIHVVDCLLFGWSVPCTWYHYLRILLNPHSLRGYISYPEVSQQVEVQVEVQVEAQVESSAYPAKATDDINYMRKEVAAIIQFLK
jgi:hypothetical protein